MKVVLKGNGGYVKVNGPKPGDWERVGGLDEATVFDLVLNSDKAGRVRFDPPLPFDDDDSRDRDRMDDYRLVHVKIRNVMEDDE